MSIDQQALKNLFDYDPDTGVCRWKVERYHGTKPGDVIEVTYDNGYPMISFRGKTHTLHKLIWVWMTGELPKYAIRHLNGVKSDNRWENLADRRRGGRHRRAVDG